VFEREGQNRIYVKILYHYKWTLETTKKCHSVRTSIVKYVSQLA